MSDWLPTSLAQMTTMGPAHLYSVGGGCSLGAPASAVWPTANKALFVPFRLQRPVTIADLWLYNGATASGNVCLGIYTGDVNPVRLLTTGSVVQGTVAVIQNFDLTATFSEVQRTIGPGLFYWATSIDNGTATIRRFSANASTVRMLGVQEMASAFPLPATATLAVLTTGTIPDAGHTTRPSL